MTALEIAESERCQNFLVGLVGMHWVCTGIQVDEDGKDAVAWLV